MKVIIKKNYEEVSEKAYEILEQQVKKKPNSVLGLATGSSPIGLYKDMILGYQEKSISFKDVCTYNLDEYVGIDKEHPESYDSFMNNNLFDHIDIQKENIHLPFGTTNEDCKAYEDKLSKVTLDLQILGIGSNGHIGFNEPGTPFTQETHIITLAQNTREDNARFFDGDINQVPTHAITMGIASIMKSKQIVLIASGANKADAVYKMIHGEITTDLPASVLQNHPDVVVIVDEAAAAKL